MNRLRIHLSRLPIQFKLTVWSSLLLFVLFIAYNFVQYLVVNNWMFHQEQVRMEQVRTEVLNYLSKQGPLLNRGNLDKTREFLSIRTDPNQMIRILDNQGQPVLTVSNQFSAEQVKPQVATSAQTAMTEQYDGNLLISRIPLQSASFSGTLEIVWALKSFDQLVELAFAIMVIGGGVAVAISGFGGYLLARQLVNPVKTITATMRKIRDNGLGERVQFHDNGDELSELALIFNEMMDRLERSFLQQKRFVEDASHELRTPISIIEGHLSLLNRWGKNDPNILEESLASATQEVKRLKLLVMELLDLSKSDSLPSLSEVPAIQPVDIIQRTVDSMQFLHEDFTFDCELSAIGTATIRIKPNHLTQILLILLDNAVKYSDKEKKIVVHGSRANHFLSLQIRDFGEGIPESDLPYVFDRFYRVDKSRSREKGGNGLGLSIAKRLVSHYHGDIRIESKLGTGTTVTMLFPITQDEK
ncbi:HAMP domain-containing sensor histidine kinase [Effusibacillus dendaii]|uniref:Signal transduction histidine-protein kinase ArlS n=1 Tax=Effusibacillus dendaii TaxID=2743772 RepID=A0A7I8DFY4_9BACL|nr:HAMP domain-containing histidine kinase [Effusibacillus dendaii]BCJ87776.1 two-component sensor histidine kinase [Effusibacillus dendaii]